MISKSEDFLTIPEDVLDIEASLPVLDAEELLLIDSEAYPDEADR